MIRVIVLSVLALVLAIAGVIVASSYLSVDDVVLPDVRGVPFERATAMLRELGVEASTFPELDASADEGAVVSQTPGPSATVRRGRTVRLGVNAIAEARQIPTVVGLGEHEAIARAASVNVPVSRVTYVASDRASGIVVLQDPEPGSSSLGARSGLQLTVSRGPADAAVELPDLRGLTLEDATRALRALGVRQIDEVASAVSFDRPFAITDQRPPPGASIFTSTPVTLVYALEGTRVVRVPDIVGEPLWRAQLYLRGAQLSIGPVQQVDDPTRPIGVLEVRPSGYTIIGSPVALVVNGTIAGIDQTPVGGIEDRLPTDAGDASPLAPRLGAPGSSATLDPRAGIGTSPRPDDDAPFVEGGDERVAEADDDGVPAPGTTVVQADGSRIIPFRFDPAYVGVASLTRNAYSLRLVVNDAQGERTVLDRRLAAGEGVAIGVEVHGDGPVLTSYVNDSFFQMWSP
ncbi:hypothetical protein BH23DEI1_BH23DEI1_13910 [soil metagenome]|nr:PASTA domain-containing protein [Trueperaceae bacterium]